METGNRFERDPRSGTQQSQQGYRDDTTGVPGEWNNPASSLGQGEEQLDNTERSGDQYAQQARYGQAGRTSDPSDTSAQYGDSERTARGQTGGYSDPTGGNWQEGRDDEIAASGVGKPTVTSKVKGTAEKMVGKVTGDPGRQARGEERKEGLY